MADRLQAASPKDRIELDYEDDDEDSDYSDDEGAEENGANQPRGNDDDDDDDDDDEGPVAPPSKQPQKKAPPRQAPKKANTKTASGKPKNEVVSNEAPEVVAEDIPDAFREPTWGKGPSPIELMQGGRNDAYARVVRKEANGPRNNFEDGDDYTGPCGFLPMRKDLETMIRKRWGGGRYEVTGKINGKIECAEVTFDGIPSKPVDEEDEDDYVPHPARSNYYHQQVAPSPQGPVSVSPTPHSPYGPYVAPPGPGPYGSSPYGWNQPAPGAQPPWSRRYFDRSDDDEKKELVEQIQEQHKQLVEVQSKTEIDRVKLEHQQQLLRLESQIDQLKAAMTMKQSGGLDDFLRFQQQLAKEDREHRERQEKLDREHRERQDKLEAQRREKEEAARREQEAARREFENRKFELELKAREEEMKRQDHMLQLTLKQIEASTSQAPKMKDLVEQLVALKKLDGDGSGSLGKLNEVLEFAKNAKDMFEGGGKEEKTTLESLGEFWGDAVVPTVTEIGKIITGAVQAPETHVSAHVVPPQQPALPYVPEQQLQPAVSGIRAGDLLGTPGGQPVQAPPPQPTASAPAQEQQFFGATPTQWGKILRHVVDSAYVESSPEITAEHLVTVCKTIDAIGALPTLAGSTPEKLVIQANMVKSQITDPMYAQYVSGFIQVGSSAHGKTWISEMLASVKRKWDAIQKKVQARQQEIDADEVDGEDGEEEEEIE